MILHLYGSHYDMYPFFVSASDSGHTGTTRDRIYVFLLHRKKVEITHDPYAMYRLITRTIMKHIRTEPADYLVSSTSDIVMEAQELASLRRKALKATQWNHSTRRFYVI